MNRFGTLFVAGVITLAPALTPKEEPPRSQFDWMLRYDWVQYSIPVGGSISIESQGKPVAIYLRARDVAKLHLVNTLADDAVKKKSSQSSESSTIAQPDHTDVRRSPVFFRTWAECRYNWPGDLRQHIQGDPHYVPSTIALRSGRAELIALHDYFHVSGNLRWQP